MSQTSRKLNSRIVEHRNYINRNTTNKSVITDHRIEFNHDFYWENVQTLDYEIFLNKRLISKKAHILMQKNDLNLRSDSMTQMDFIMLVLYYNVNKIDQLAHLIFTLYFIYNNIPLLRILFYASS